MLVVGNNNTITVYYDGSCPGCVKDRNAFEWFAGKRASRFIWFDITGQEDALRRQGIEPINARRELHIKDGQGVIHSEMDAYSLLMKDIPLLWVLGTVICLPVIKPVLSYLYRKSVDKRLSCKTS